VAPLPAHPDGDQVRPLPEPVGPACTCTCRSATCAARTATSRSALRSGRGAGPRARDRAGARAARARAHAGAASTSAAARPAGSRRRISSRSCADRRALTFAPGHERSLEANPEDLVRSKLEAWRAAGVTRLSVGVQSFDDAELSRLGRVHDARAAETGVAKRAGVRLRGRERRPHVRLPGNDEAHFAQPRARGSPSGPRTSRPTPTPPSPARRWGRGAEGRARAARRGHGGRALRARAGHAHAAGYRHYEISNFRRPGARRGTTCSTGGAATTWGSGPRP
jgi:hypothetical protein